MTSTSPAPASAPLLDVRGLIVEFGAGRGRPPLRAVDDVDLSVAAGETVGLVGESGSGKTTLGRAVLGLTPVTHGTIAFDGAEITHAGHRARRSLSSELQVVFQDPYSSLNPTRTIGQTLGRACARKARAATARPASASARCWRRSGSIETPSTAIRRSSRADSASASRSRVR